MPRMSRRCRRNLSVCAVPEIRLFTDEQISNALILGLRQRGVEVLSVTDTGRDGMSDESHLLFARDNGYVILTEDQDFLILSSETTDHHGIIFARQSMRIGEAIRGVLLVTSVLTADEMKGRVEFL